MNHVTCAKTEQEMKSRSSTWMKEANLMYLSRLTLNPRNARGRSELARPYEMHRSLLQAFQHGQHGINRASEEAAGVLFRVDEQPREQKITVLVQSKIAPAWSTLSD